MQSPIRAKSYLFRLFYYLKKQPEKTSFAVFTSRPTPSRASATQQKIPKVLANPAEYNK
jgi:hypothetical protein